MLELQKTFPVMSISGIHARPAQKIVEVAKRYTEEIHLVKDGQMYNAKNLLMILSMGARYKEEITVMATGEKSKIIIMKIGDLLSNK